MYDYQINSAQQGVPYTDCRARSFAQIVGIYTFSISQTKRERTDHRRA